MSGGDLTFNHITSILNFQDDSTIRNHFMLAVKDTLSDLSFVYADFLLYYIKKDFPVVIVNLAQSFHHYNQIMLKSGINMKSLREKNKVISIDVLSETESIIGCSQSEIEKSDKLCSIIYDPCNANCLKALFKTIQKGIETALNSSKGQFLLLIDEINVLINLGVPLKAIQPFVLNCYSLCVKESGMLLIGSLLDANDVDSMKQINYLSHICDIELYIEGLKTGYSKDIQGKISCENRDKANGTCISRKMFFKVEDKGAKFFTDGL